MIHHGSIPQEIRRNRRTYRAPNLLNQFGAGRLMVREALFSLQRKGVARRTTGACRACFATRCQYARRRSLRFCTSYGGSAGQRPPVPEGSHAVRGRPRLEFRPAGDDVRRAENPARDSRGQRPAIDQPIFIRTDLAFHCTLAMITHNLIFASIHHAPMRWLSDQRSILARAGATRAKVFG